MFIDDQQTGTLKITLMSATNLQSADSNNLSDPYCLLTVTSLHQLVNCMVIKDGDTVTNTTLPPTTTTTTTTTSPSLQQSQSSQSLNHDGSFRSRSNSNSRSNYDTIQSRVSGIVKKNLNPCWNQVFSFTVGPREQTVVEFKVFDYDKKGNNDLLGQARFYCNLLSDFIETEVRLELDTQGVLDLHIMYTPGNEYGRIMRQCLQQKQHYTDHDFGAMLTSVCRSRQFCSQKNIDEKCIFWMRPKEYCAMSSSSSSSSSSGSGSGSGSGNSSGGNTPTNTNGGGALLTKSVSGGAIGSVGSVGMMSGGSVGSGQNSASASPVTTPTVAMKQSNTPTTTPTTPTTTPTTAAAATMKTGQTPLSSPVTTTVNSPTTVVANNSSFEQQSQQQQQQQQLLPQLFLDGIDPSDIRQQLLGDCYFLAALSAVAQQPQWIYRMISPSTYNEYGVYQVNFFWQGATRSVVVDDLIPVLMMNESGVVLGPEERERYLHSRKSLKPPSSQTPKSVQAQSSSSSNVYINTLFARSANLREIWVSIIEKAYAKLHGNYENVEHAHDIGEAMEHLTGGVSHNFDLKTEPAKPLFQQMLEWRRFKYPMVCSTNSSQKLNFETRQKATLYGIIPRHAYTVLDVRLVDDIQFIKLRNTWGKSEWRGKYSDNDGAWTDRLRKKLKVDMLDDGIFWMEFADFVIHFNRLHICSVPMDTFVSPAIRHEWNKQMFTCGGLYDDLDRDKFCRNPQFGLSILSDRSLEFSGDQIRVLIIVQLEDTSKEDEAREDGSPICVYVVKSKKAVGNETPIASFKNMQVIAKSQGLKMRRNCVEVLLPKPIDGRKDDYFVIVSNFHANREGSFIARCFSDWENTKFVALHRSDKCSITKVIGSWNESSINGPHYETTTFESNPKFLLQLPNNVQGNNLPDSTPLQLRCKVRDAKVPFFPYLISLHRFKKYKNSNDYAPLTSKDCLLFPDARNTFFSRERIFACQLKKKQKSWILILSTPSQTNSQFLLEFVCEYPLEISNLE